MAHATYVADIGVAAIYSLIHSHVRGNLTDSDRMMTEVVALIRRQISFLERKGVFMSRLTSYVVSISASNLPPRSIDYGEQRWAPR